MSQVDDVDLSLALVWFAISLWSRDGFVRSCLLLAALSRPRHGKSKQFQALRSLHFP